MNIRAFRTWCKENGIKPVSGYTNAGYVTGLMRDKGYSHISNPTKKECLKSPCDNVKTLCQRQPTITDVVYFYWINKSVSDPIYYIHIFYKKEIP